MSPRLRAWGGLAFASLAAATVFALAFGVSWFACLIGVLAIWGWLADLGEVVATRLLGSEAPPFFSLMCGALALGAWVMALAILNVGSGHREAVWTTGVVAFVWGRRRPGALERRFDLRAAGPPLAAALLVALIALPAYLPAGAAGIVEIDGFYLLDGLWFSGSSLALDQGLVPPDPRAVGYPLGYHYFALAIARGLGRALPLPQAAVDHYLFMPLFAGLTAAAAVALAGRVIPRAGRGAGAWWVALGTVALTDGADFMRWIGAAQPELSAWFERPLAHFVFGQHHTIGLLINLPYACALAFGLGALWVWAETCASSPAEAEPPRTRWPWALTWLVAAAGLAKGSVVPLAAGLGICAGGWALIRRARRRELELGTRLGTDLGTAGALLAGAAAAGIVAWLVDAGGEIHLRPGYMLDFLRNYARAHTAVFEAWQLDRVGPVVLLYLVFGLGWRTLLLALPRVAEDRALARRLTVALALSWLGGFVLANAVEFDLVGGANELTFVSYALGLSTPLALAVPLALRSWPARGLALILLAPGLFGSAHLLAARRLDGAREHRELPAAQAELYAQIRTQLPRDAVVMYFRHTTLDGDPRRPTPPTNDQHYLISGWGERQALLEGSFYGALWTREGIAPLRADIDRFYAGQLSADEAQDLWAKYGVTHLIDEKGTGARRYAPQMELVWTGGPYALWRVTATSE